MFGKLDVKTSNSNVNSGVSKSHAIFCFVFVLIRFVYVELTGLLHGL